MSPRGGMLPGRRRIYFATDKKEPRGIASPRSHFVDPVKV